jgi:hypothetical protein
MPEAETLNPAALSQADLTDLFTAFNDVTVEAAGHPREA